MKRDTFNQIMGVFLRTCPRQTIGSSMQRDILETHIQLFYSFTPFASPATRLGVLTTNEEGRKCLLQRLLSLPSSIQAKGKDLSIRSAFPRDQRTEVSLPSGGHQDGHLGHRPQTSCPWTLMLGFPRYTGH